MIGNRPIKKARLNRKIGALQSKIKSMIARSEYDIKTLDTDNKFFKSLTKIKA